MQEFLEFFDERYSNGAFLLIVCGVILFVLGFLGCCGASKESPCMLYTFAALLSIIVMAEVRVIIFSPGLRELASVLVRNHATYRQSNVG